MRVVLLPDVSRRVSVPSASMTKRSKEPERALENAICDASGDQAGSTWKNRRAGDEAPVSRAA